MNEAIWVSLVIGLTVITTALVWALHRQRQRAYNELQAYVTRIREEGARAEDSGGIRIDSAIDKGDAYEQADAALCIWEHAISSVKRFDDSPVYRWLTEGDGAAHARMNSIQIAHLVEYAYRIGNGEGQPGEEPHWAMTSYCYDWDVVPVIVDQFMDEADGPSEITLEIAERVGRRLPEIMRQEQGA